MTIKNPDVRILAGISQALQAEYQSENREWEEARSRGSRPAHPDRSGR